MTNLKTITVRNVDESMYIQMKIKCMIHKCPVGTAISEAMELWIKSKNEEENEHPL